MRASGMILVLAAVAIAGCKGDRGTRKKGAAGEGAGAAQGTSASPAARRGRPHMPPFTVEIASAITGKKLRPWAHARPAGAGPVAGQEVPEQVRAELVALLEPVAKARPTIRWVRVMKRDGGAMTVALSYSHALEDQYGKASTVGFTTARDRQGKFHIRQTVQITEHDGANWQPGEDRDVDGDGVPDTLILYNQKLDSAGPGEAAAGGLVILGSKTASSLSVQLYKRTPVDGQIELARPFTNCWATISGKQLLLVIRQEDTMVEAGGEEKSMKTKYTAEVYAADKAGNLRATTLYAGILGGATQADPLLDEWADWTKSEEGPAIALEPRSEAWLPTECPVGERLAFIVPKRATKPKGNLGYYLVAWPSLLKADTAKEVDASGLPETAVVEIGGE